MSLPVSSTSAADGAEASGRAPSSDGTPLPPLTMTHGESNAYAESRPLDGGPDCKPSAPTSAPSGMPASMVAWMESQRASLAEILAQQAAVLDLRAQARARHIAESLRQSTIFDLPGCSWKIAPLSEPEAEQESPPISWRATCAGETESLPRLIVAPLTSESDGTALLPTLTICGNYNAKGASPTSGDGLVTALRRHLPTLLAHDRTSPGVGHRERGGRSACLPEAIKLLPTLCATDFKSPYSAEGYQAQRLRPSKPLRDTAAHQIGIRLCQTFCEYWMGWPLQSSAMLTEGSALLPSETPGSPSKRQRRSRSSEARE